jgi:hypothetical protein
VARLGRETSLIGARDLRGKALCDREFFDAEENEFKDLVYKLYGYAQVGDQGV